jgi:hypothetical protein
MRKLSIGIALALVSAMLLALPVLANGKAGENGSGGKGRVDGHLEGANPVAARVCVDYDGDDIYDVCEDIERPDNSGFGITIPKPFVATATFSAWARSRPW